MASGYDRGDRPGREYAGPEDRIAAVESDLLAEFNGVASAGTVSDVVLAARRDLAREVPLESLDEFLHRLARQRLLDVCRARGPRGAGEQAAVSGHPGGASPEEERTTVVTYRPATRTDLRTGAVTAPAGSAVHAALVQLPDGLREGPGDIPRQRPERGA